MRARLSKRARDVIRAAIEFENTDQLEERGTWWKHTDYVYSVRYWWIKRNALTRAVQLYVDGLNRGK